MTIPVAASVQNSVTVREAVESDDLQICELMRRIVMPGGISLAVCYEPSFFEAVEVEGQSCRVVVREHKGKIVGTGLMAGRRVYLNGEPTEIGYVSGLRIDPSIRYTTVLARGNDVFRQWHEEHFRFPLYLASILRENLLARKLFTSGRVGFPACRDVGILYTASIPLIWRRKPRCSANVRIVRGGDVGAGAIVEYLNKYGRDKQFYPVYTVDDLLAADGILRGLSVDDFYVACSGNKIQGVTACWNQQPFRRMIVAGYRGIFKLAKPLVSPIARALHLAPLPKAGDAIKTVMAACIAIENNDPRIFEALLQSILQTEYNTGKTFLMVGLMEGDYLMKVVRKYKHVPTRSCIYSLQWSGANFETDGRIPYLELGSL